MTREEAIGILKEIIDEGWLISDFEKCTAIDACEMAIEALEREPVIDKIRAEIGNINLNEVVTKYEDRFYGFQQEVIKILDKYKGENEDNKE